MSLGGFLKRSVVCIGAAGIVLTVTPAAQAYEFTSRLKPGAKGADVKALQVRVAGWFPRGDQARFRLDGEFGPSTMVAVKAFQSHYGLTATGIAGSDTLAKLNALEDKDGSTAHFDYSEFWQNSNSSCSRKANSYAGTFKGGLVSEGRVKKNVRRLMWRLEAIRAKGGGKPIGINSGFRSVAYNDCIGGATYSQHQFGNAADLRMQGISNRGMRDTAKKSQVHGIGCYSTLSHNHFDLRLENGSLAGAQAWWWPNQDRYSRDLADDNRPCWGETRKTEASSVDGPIVGIMSDGSETPTHAELEHFEHEGEADDLHGLD